LNQLERGPGQEQKDLFQRRTEVIYRGFKRVRAKSKIVIPNKSRVRPYLGFLLYAYLPEQHTQKPGQGIQAQASYGKIWIGKSKYFRKALTRNILKMNVIFINILLYCV